MKKLLYVLIIIIVALSITCGVLVYQTSNLQNTNKQLQDHNDIFKDAILGYQNQTREQEKQISELENQLNATETQYFELLNQTSELETQISILTSGMLVVRISRFTVDGLGNMNGVILDSTINVTVRNYGINNANGLSLSIRQTSGGEPPKIIQVGSIPAGEERTFNLKATWTYTSGIFVATLMIENIVLDEYTTPVVF